MLSGADTDPEGRDPDRDAEPRHHRRGGDGQREDGRLPHPPPRLDTAAAEDRTVSRAAPPPTCVIGMKTG